MADSELQELQRDQRRHDEFYHRDVYYLPYPRRMSHLVLHIAKYAGRAWAVPPQQNAADPAFRKILVDAFIVSLSACEILNLNLSRELAAGKNVTSQSVRELGTAFVQRDQREPTAWLNAVMPNLANLAKAMESLDHMEPVDSRRMLAEGFVAILKATIAGSASLGLDLAVETRKRWKEVETNRVL